MNNLSWPSSLLTELNQPYFIEMQQKIAQQRAQGIDVFPAEDDIFKALQTTDFEHVKVVILGQDPYHGEGQANGLAFSVNKGMKFPPSLNNIFKELVEDISGFNVPEHGDLHKWAEQGVLLLNTVLTVQKGKAHSHAKLGWERFTDAIIEVLNQQKQGVIFLLWGAHAQKKGQFIDKNKHTVLSSVHPSPLSAYRGFFGCKHFSKTNQLLQSQQQQPIDWCL